MTAIPDNTVADPQQIIAELERKLDELTAQQAATVDILKVIASSPGDVQPVFEVIADRAMTLLDCWSVIVTRFDGEYVQFGAARGALPDTEQFARQRYQSMRPGRASLLGRSLLERTVVSSADAQAEPDPQLRDYARKRGLRAVLVVPLLRDDKVEGALVLSRAEPGLFAPREIELVQTFADQAVIAIQNARLFGEVQARTRDLTESLEQQTATSEVLEVISASTGELEPVFQKMLENATRVCGANFGVMSLYDGDSFRNVALCNVPPAYGDSPQTFRPHPESAMGMLARTRHAVQFEDVRTHAPYLEGNPTAIAMVDLAGARTLVAVPMLRENELVGAIAIYRQEVRPFTGKQIELVANFASQAVIAIENARLLNELRKRTDDLSESLEQQTATSEVLQIISSSPGELEPVFQKMLENAARVCGANFGILNLYDGDRFEIVAIYNVPPAYAASLNSKLIRPHPEGPLGTLVRTRQVVHIHDLTKNPAYLAGDPAVVAITDVAGARTIVIVPMVKEDELIGTIAIYRKEIRPFNDKQIALVENFTKQAAIAIENTRLLKELHARTDDLSESLQQQTATADVLKVISRSAFDLQIVLDTLISSAVELSGASGGTICLREGDGYRYLATSGMEDGFKRFLLGHPPTPGRASAAGRVLLSANVESIPDVLEDPDYVLPVYELNKTRSVVGVPLLRNDKVEGALVLNRTEPGPFTARLIELVQTFADQAVIAIENARLFDEVQARTEDLRESLQQQTATADVLKVISRSTFDLQAVLQTLVESAARLCEADKATITRQKEGIFYRAENFGFSQEFMDYVRGVPVEPERGSAQGRALLEGLPVHIPDVQADPNYTFTEGQRLGDFRTILAVPMLREGTPIGVLALTRSIVQPFTDKQIELVTTFADQAAIAIENVRLFDEVQARTRDLTEALTYQTGSSKILSVIASSPTDVRPVLNAVVESACELCEAYDAIVVLKDGGDLVSSAHHGPIPMIQARWPNDRNAVSGRAVADRLPVHLRDVLSDEGSEFPTAQEMARLNGFRSILGVPMIRNDEAVGAILLRRTEVHPFSDKQISLLQTFADQAVIAIGNVRMFEQVQQRTKELSLSLDELRGAQERLIQTEKLASLGQLTAGIAHEIKNPLNFVNNFAALSAELTDELNDVLKSAALAEKTREEVGELTGMLKENLGKVVQHGKRADSIVKNMLLHSREGSGEHRPADINALLEESLNLAYHGARAEKPQFNVTLQRGFDEAAGTIDVFPQEITRVFLNLISNGFYAVTKRKTEIGSFAFEPTVRVTTRNLGHAVEIRIRDNGTGIPAEVKEKMFNPFFTTKPAGEGTGLGLSMSYDIIVKQHGGIIDVDTAIGAFTEFRIILPRAGASLIKSGEHK